MDFNFSEGQLLLRDVVRDFLENECPLKVVREINGGNKGHSERLWQEMSRLGWTGLVFPEQYGGFWYLVLFEFSEGVRCFGHMFGNTGFFNAVEDHLVGNLLECLHRPDGVVPQGRLP